MYDKILVPLDGSQVAECVIPYIEGIARASNGEVQLITIVEPVEIPTRGRIALSEDDMKKANEDYKQEAHKYLEQVAQKLARAGIRTRDVLLVGKPAESLIEYANNNQIDLVIMATHGRSGISKLFWGSIAEKVMRSVNVPVLLIKTALCEADA
jgi:nucleotide-binding universal stress UspA family protein